MTAAIVFMFLLSGLLWLAPLISDPMGVLFWRGGAHSDLLISHWPNAAFVRQSLIQWGQVPLWNPMILSGAPFAADPLSGLFYPPSWLAFALNPGVAFNLLAWLHIAWGGVGMWKLARALGLSSGPGIAAGLAFAGMPKMIGHIGLGHVSLVFAVYWTPWVLLAFERAIRDMSTRSAALAGAALGLVFLIDPRWYLPLALLSGAFAGRQIAHSRLKPSAEDTGEGAPKLFSLGDEEGQIGASGECDLSAAQQANAGGGEGEGETAGEHAADVEHPRAREGSHSEASANGDGRVGWVRSVASLVVAGLMSLAVAAILAVPLGEFVSLSTRASLSVAQSTELSLPLAHLVNVLAPEYAGWPEWQAYAGVVVLLLALATLPGRARGRWFWVGVAISSIILALGDLTPIYGLMSALIPGFGQLRVPPRSLFLSSFALALLAGMGLDGVLDGKARIGQLRILGAALAGIALVSALVLGLRDQAPLPAAAYLVSAALIGLSIVWAGISTRKRSNWSIAGWCLLIMLDLSLVNLTTVEMRPGPDVPVEWVPLQANNPRTFSPSYSLPQPGAAAAGLELADGINPLQLASYSAYMSRATGFSEGEYSVTLPPFVDPQAKWGFQPDLALMGRLAISQVISAYPIKHSDLEFERTEQGRYYYGNPQARPRTWIDGGGSVQVMERTPNWIVIRAAGPGRLVASEIAYPGWEVEIDGEQAEMEIYEGLLRAVQLESGEHEVKFVFRSYSLRAGALVTLLGLILLASLWIRR